MSTPCKLVFAALMLSCLLLAGCQSMPLVSGSNQNICDYDYSRLMEAGWSFYRQTLWPAGKDGELDAFQCVVLYRVESQQVPPEPDIQFTQNIAPVFGMVFRRDRNRPLDIHAYSLKLPNDMYLGERNVSTRVADDVLSGANKPQLIIEGRDASDLIVEASIWEWNEQTLSENSSYKSRGWFLGDAGVTVDKNRVTVLNRWLNSPRSQLAQRKVYLPRDNKSYYPKPDPNKPEDTSTIVNPVTVDLVPLVMPDDAHLPAAEYPEKLVLAFYQRIPLVITDTIKLTPIMSSDMIDSYGKRDPKVFGCLADARLTKVYIQDLNLNGSQGIPPHIENENKTITDTVGIMSRCEIGGKLQDNSFWIAWQVRWDWNVDARTGKWQIVGATAQ